MLDLSLILLLLADVYLRLVLGINGLSCRSYSSSSCGLQVTVFDDFFHALVCFFVWFDVKSLIEVCWVQDLILFQNTSIFSLSTYFYLFFFLMLPNLQLA